MTTFSFLVWCMNASPSQSGNLTVIKAERKKHINMGSVPLRRQVQYQNKADTQSTADCPICTLVSIHYSIAGVKRFLLNVNTQVLPLAQRPEDVILDDVATPLVNQLIYVFLLLGFSLSLNRKCNSQWKFVSLWPVSFHTTSNRTSVAIKLSSTHI